MHTSLLPPSSPRRIARLALPLAIVAVTALTACSDGDDSTASPEVSASAVPLLGPTNKATGTPVKVGFAFEGTTTAIDTSNQAKAAEAVVAYANEHLGGLGGRPVELVKCETKGNPATAADCANQFVQAGVLAAVSGGLGQTGPLIKGINPAGIPLFDIQNPAVIGSDINFSVANPLNAFGGPAAFAKKQGLTSAALIVIDVPAAVDPAKGLGATLFKNAGAVSTVIAVAPGVADLTPQIQAAEGANPAMYHIIGNPSFCTAAFKAIKTLGIKKPVTTIDRCLDDTGAASIPGGYEGLNIFTPANVDPATKEYKEYEEILKTYGNVEIDADSTVAYQAMMAFFRAGDATGDLKDFSPAGLIAAIRAMPATDVPLGGGGTFKCDGKALTLSKVLCSAQGITAKSDKDGNLSDFVVLDDASIYLLG
jgi:branched-chain amino acid transport system substrate-binding protein